MKPLNKSIIYENFSSNKDWSDLFIDKIKEICAPVVIRIASEKEDRLHATDLISSPIRIACRVRRHKYWKPYSNEFTLRCKLPTGNLTEIDKIMAGWGDYYFYGFSNADDNGSGFSSWVILDLDIFRSEYQKWEKRQPTSIRFSSLISNTDKSSKFRAFVIDSFPPNFVIKRKEREKEKQLTLF